jgi:hypothetical protein
LHHSAAIPTGAQVELNDEVILFFYKLTHAEANETFCEYVFYFFVEFLEYF